MATGAPIGRFDNDIPSFGRDSRGDVVTVQADDHPRLATTVLSALERERAKLVSDLAAYRCKDYAEYLGRFMQIEGVDIAIHHVKEQAKKLG